MQRGGGPGPGQTARLSPPAPCWRTYPPALGWEPRDQLQPHTGSWGLRASLLPGLCSSGPNHASCPFCWDELRGALQKAWGEGLSGRSWCRGPSSGNLSTHWTVLPGRGAGSGLQGGRGGQGGGWELGVRAWDPAVRFRVGASHLLVALGEKWGAGTNRGGHVSTCGCCRVKPRALGPQERGPAGPVLFQQGVHE